MESECLEPLNLVIKKDNNSDNNDDDKESDKSSVSSMNKSIDDKIDSVLPKMTIDNTSKPNDNNTTQLNDQKLINALHMSNLMQMSNMTLPNDVNTSSSSYGSQYYFMQLLAMVEAQQLMSQQMNWSLPQQLIRNPLRLPQPYFDSTTTNITEQLTNSQTSTTPYSLPNIKCDIINDSKQSNSKRYFIMWKNNN